MLVLVVLVLVLLLVVVLVLQLMLQATCNTQDLISACVSRASMIGAFHTATLGKM